MPIYEYECGKCGEVVEKIHGMNDKPSVKCPKCGGKARRKISSAAFHLKGSGWYVTDYGKKSKLKDSESPSSEKGAKKEGAAASPGSKGKPLPKLSTDPS